MLNNGTLIRINSKEWYEKNKNASGRVDCATDTFMEEMTEYCGKVAVIEHYLCDERYTISIDHHKWNWSTEMFEVLYEMPVLKPGMLIYLNNADLEGTNFWVVFPTQKELALIKYNNDHTWMPVPYTEITAIRDLSKSGDNLLNSGNLLWKKPKTIEISLKEIADKFGVDVNDLKIKKQ